MLLFRADRLKEAERTRSNIKEGKFSSSFFFQPIDLFQKREIIDKMWITVLISFWNNLELGLKNFYFNKFSRKKVFSS